MGKILAIILAVILASGNIQANGKTELIHREKHVTGYATVEQMQTRPIE